MKFWKFISVFAQEKKKIKVELKKFLSCMDVVFKLLHVEITRKATDGKEKNNNKWRNFWSFTVCNERVCSRDRSVVALAGVPKQ